MSELTVNDLIQIYANNYIKQINIPNLTVAPYVICPIELQNQQYYFKFYWNIRHQRLYLTIFRIQNGQNIYYLKNRLLSNGINLSKYIYNTDWSGYLTFESISNNFKDDYTFADINEKFILVYYGSE